MVNVTKWTNILETVADVTIDCCQMMDEQKKKKQNQNGTYNNYDDDNSVIANTTNTNTNNNNNTDVTSQLDDGSNIPLSTCNGNKKSLFIGINYYGSKSELRGCINDVTNIKAFVVKNFNFPTDSDHMRTLTDDGKGDDKPTRANMITAMKWLVANAQSGDSLFLHYSGHGGSQKAANNDEQDGCDETLIPVDYESSGVIVDNDLHDLLVAGLPKGVRLTCVMDCCHSGSILDLPYTYGVDANGNTTEKDNRKALIKAAINAGMLLVQGKKQAALMAGINAVGLHFANQKNGSNGSNGSSSGVTVKTTLGDVIQFSGCRDDQTSADASIGGEATGAMSWSLITAFEKNGFNQTYVQLLSNIRNQLQGKYSQVPQMSTGHRMNLNTTFKM